MSLTHHIIQTKRHIISHQSMRTKRNIIFVSILTRHRQGFHNNIRKVKIRWRNIEKGLLHVLSLSNERQKLNKKEVMNMKMEDLKRKIHELWPKLVTDNN